MNNHILFNKQKIKNDKQAKEIERQNKFLISMNEIPCFGKIFID